MTPVQWNIYVVDLEPRVGTKPGKQRPVIVIQPTEFAAAGLGSSVILPITSQPSNENAWPLRVKIPKGVCGLTKNSEAMIDQIIAWDHSLFKKDIGALPLPIIKQIKAAVREYLDL
jgi:mRNA interferase MazF